MLKRKTIFIVVVVLAVIGASLFLLLNRDNGAETAKVEKKRFIKSVYASGYVDSVNKVIVKPEISGYIDEIYVSEGDGVRKGQILASILNEPIKENLREIRTQKEFARNRLDEGSDYLKVLKDEIEIKRLNLENQENNYQRRKALLQKGIISRESYEDAERNYEIAQREYKKSVENYNDAVDSLKTQLETLTAKEESLMKELDKYSVTSPVDGEILRKFVEEGDYVNNMSQNNEMFSVGDTKNLETVLLVDEEYIPLIKEGLKVLVNTDAFPDKVFEGRIKLIEKESDRRTRTVKVKADVDYPENIPIGVTVEANIILSDGEGFFISKEFYKDGYVNVLQDGKPVKKPVKVGRETEDYIEVTDGLKEGQNILIK
ncbi:MAG TPA: efflux RND transporter periplasmic adaptor subunit [Thermodesulfobacteriota bacterium]|nr:efflux RND transporter periplasmic adaptor subunit [Thermodesulfobacteriota bacterium]